MELGRIDKNATMENDKESEDDNRLDFILSFVIKTMKLKIEKWHKMMGIEEFRKIVNGWVDDPINNLLLIGMNNSGNIFPTSLFPINTKYKTCYFLKKLPVKLTNDNITHIIICGDISIKPIDDLAILVDEIFFPILNNPKNYIKWPDMTAEDMQSQLQGLRNTISEVKGSIMNKTMLPMPITIDQAMEIQTDINNGNLAACNLKIKNSLEGIIIKWVSSISDVLKEDSNQKFLNGGIPTPLDEIEFWNLRRLNLQNIYDQLCSNQVKCVALILEKVDSVYFTSFKTILKSLIIALVIAKDITLWITPLKKSICTFQSTNFLQSEELIKPLLHCICLIWANSHYYCTNTNLLKLFRMVCNMFIAESTKCLDSSTLFQGEADDALIKIEKNIEMLKYFRREYYEYRNNLNKFVRTDRTTPPIFWTFNSDAMFERFDLYIKRLNEIRTVISTSIDFIKLEKIEIGGIKGKNISRSIVKILDEFHNTYGQWIGIQYDPLDPDPGLKEFTSQKKKFFDKIDVLDRKLGSLFCQAFIECSNLEQITKHLQMVGNIIQRPIIFENIKDKLYNVIAFFQQELELVNSIFDGNVESFRINGFEGILINSGFPPVAGVLMSMYMLRERISKPIRDFQFLEYPILDNENGKIAVCFFHKIIEKILQFESEIYENWSKEIPNIILIHLNDYLLKRNENMSIDTNFHLNLEMISKEIQYLTKICNDKISDELIKFCETSNRLWKIRLKITRITEWYNFVREQTMPCEYQIIEKQIIEIDQHLYDGLHRYKWNDYDEEYLDFIHNNIKDLYGRILKCQRNVEAICSSVRKWGNLPLFTRKDGKCNTLLYIDHKEVKVRQRFDECDQTNLLIKTITEENCKLLYNSNKENGLCLQDLDSQNLEPNVLKYLGYQEYLEKLLIHELTEAVYNSLKYILFEMENRFNHNSPLFEVKFTLENNSLTFTPNLLQMEGVQKSELYIIIEMLINDIFNIATGIEKVISSEENYFNSIKNNKRLEETKHKILTLVSKTTYKTITTMKQFDKYSYLWLEDKAETLKFFMKYGRTPNNSDLQNIELIESHPNLESYKEQIENYNSLYEEINKIDARFVFENWLLVDLKLFKYTLLNEVCKWNNLFKQNLVDHVTVTLNELELFINNSMIMFESTITNEDFATLLTVMSALSEIKDRQLKTNNMFAPLKEIVELLKDYDVEFNETIQSQFIDLPEKWSRLKKISFQIRQNVAPVRSFQLEQICKQILLFDATMKSYRNKFHNLPFFQVPCSNIYYLCNDVNNELRTIENQYDNLKNSADIFELTAPTKEQINQCRKELKMIKQLWDFVYVIDTSVSDWKKTPWKQIDVEEMEQECKKLAKEIRTLDRAMRNWIPYVYLEKTLKNLVTSLRAITELQNPALRERHWIELMQITKLMEIYGKEILVKFTVGGSTTLSDLLDLHLHEYEDDVKYIVDKSVKEMEMEKTLQELQTTWSIMRFEYDVYPRTDIKLLRATEELIETLEENQVQLQNLLGSKYIKHFYTEILQWQTLLANTDQVIGIWFEVQRKWIYLESIFVGSDDIRSQLPDDSERFDAINLEFRRILNSLCANENVIKVTNTPKLYEELDILVHQLIRCEKALNDYLETKRLAFPRFYFVSSVDLLDILSNGNKPVLITRHLTKLYDSISRLKFGDDQTTVFGIIATEYDEYIEFNEPCDCDGKVEDWLNRLTNSMKKTLHHSFEVAVETYQQKARDSWIFDWPAQTCLCVTQIWWSSEVNTAFMHLEEGYENSLKDYNKKQIQQLNALINLLLGDLTVGDRQKIMTICTIDVHSRDVVTKMINQKIENSLAFQWQSQLRHRWDSIANDCYANICDAEFLYDYEYLGNTPRLVITPLTDRCYITLTQSLHLIMGGAPAGPAGTGKTETTKDLGRALGVMVYVFNCSEQMDYKSCGNIYKGLSLTGAWGCFDEFNRISVEVLSVVAVQVKSIQDAIKAKKIVFNFMGEMIPLVPTIGIFITMNPGYAGRTELPENLKALFRPCAMVVPDFELICEIMLVAEGFQEARILARKFIALYTLCRELLSKQDHYDWGLRAIKSVLVVAGSLKRSDRQRPEDQVLMRALRDFNTPKIVTADVPVFMGLISDLFPALDVPRKRCLDFEKLVRKSATDLNLQQEDGYILKIVQLEELFAVRHSVFIVGDAGTGKTAIWKGLFRTYQNQNLKPYYNDLNPKAVTNDELFGIINPSTREWKDGLFSSIMRDQANMPGSGPKWIVLDGDIDPMWIESLNTVMDDNKVLTLASNERIALNKEMRLLFEIGNLKTATPATVSRAGILYINPQDLGWYPFVSSWIDRRENQTEKTCLTLYFDRYIPNLMEANQKFKKITPISDITMIQMTCHLLNCLLTTQNCPTDCPKEWYETYFVFSVIWGFGSALFQDQMIDWRLEFHKWWINEYKTIKFPSSGTIFNYYIDPETKQFRPWSNLISEYELDIDIPLLAILVPTAETTKLKYFLNLLMEQKHPVMLIGGAGCGKSVVVAEKLKNLPEKYAVTNVPFNFYTTSEILQTVLEKPLEKKAGRNFGPTGNKSMIYFIDDLNMPEVDKYETVQPHTIIRQFMDYQHWYDRSKLTLKDIHNCQFVSCMNPTAGAFTIDPRLQRHFYAFAVNFPCNDSLFNIYNSILSQHLSNTSNKFSVQVQKACPVIIQTALNIHGKVANQFLPTAIKFHYIFNLRDLANIFQGVLFATHESCPDPNALIRIYIHEATRVYCDKLVNSKDIDSFRKLILETTKKDFEDMEEVKVFAEPMLYSHFAHGIVDLKYMPVESYEKLGSILEHAQNNYNEIVGALNLVLFEDAMNHVCRISRIIEGPRGNALLIGVGGSGKQSLSRLAAFISSLSVTQIQLKKGYSIADLKMDLSVLYTKVGVKNVGSMLLITDSQVAEEEFLVLINDMLASGEIPELFSDDEIDQIVNAVRNEVKQLGILDTKPNCWQYFIDKVRKMLKTVLCFSPVGSTLRVRARKFPAVINCTAIDWFHEWPKKALESVSHKFLAEIDILPKDLTGSVSSFMGYVHGTVNDISKTYKQNEKRYNYTTPKTFLELIFLYKKLLTDKTDELNEKITRLENGILKLSECAIQVDALQEQLSKQEIELKIKNEMADNLIVVVSAENKKVQKEKFLAAEEEQKVRVIGEDVSLKAKLCEEDLRKAEPALEAAQEALNTLNKNNLTELKSFGSPPTAVVNVCSAVMVLFSPNGKIPKDRSWKAAKAIMGKVDQFLSDLINYDKEHIRPNVIQALQPYLQNPEFEPTTIAAKSVAAAGLCAWVININKFYEVFLVVEPKQRALVEAQQELKSAQGKLHLLNEQIKDLEKKMQIIQDEFDGAYKEKQKCQTEADKTAFTIDLANRLVGGLASENIRWRDSVTNFKNQIVTLAGDALLVACFISYVGCFTRTYRSELLERMWIPTFQNMKPYIPHTFAVDPLKLVCDETQIASWNNEGLPNDRMSTENAAILTNSARWPLMIDPQLQGIRWIKNRYGKDLIIIRLSTKGYIDIIETALTKGNILLIENIEETVDAVLEPLLGRILIKKGKFIKIGDKEMDYNPNFRLILHTKLSNPHYKPEMQAQTTLINFTVTKDGLEEQLLAEVVKAERSDLEKLKTDLTKHQNTFKITLKALEDDLLKRLASAGENVLDDPTLVLNLEKTKKTAQEIEQKVKEAKTTAAAIDVARENYRSIAQRASILYFILNDLYKINPIYQFSLKAFIVVFKNAIEKSKTSDKMKERVEYLIDSITFSVFMYTSRGLFERDKLIFMSQMVIQILLQAKEINLTELDFLLRYPYIKNITSPFDFLSNIGWGGIKVLSTMEEFRNLDKDIENSTKRWKKFIESECPEKEKFPGEWKNKTALQRICMMRALRPDRMTYAIKGFVEEKLGAKYVEARTVEFKVSFEESCNTTPIFFILSPGVDPLLDVERIARKLNYSLDNGNFYNVSLGQGQEIIAEAAIDSAAQYGHWVILQNIHLVAKWLPTLEKKIESTTETSHEDYRLFISAEPASSSEYHIIPQGILESAIKITNEPPTGMRANIHKALDNFSQETFEMCSKEAEFKSILFSLCYFHAVVAERRKFGPQGWNRSYPFNIGDLTISVYVLFNYLEANSKVPWEDLRYLFGEIMYGGHITDDWDRRLCRTYLEEFMQPDLIDGELYLCPGFLSPPNSDFLGYHEYIDSSLPPESPYLYGLHSNAEIGFLTTLSDQLFKRIFELQPRDSGSGQDNAKSRDENVKLILEDIIDKLPEEINMGEVMGRVEERTPYIIVAFQECARMNILMQEMRRSLKELYLGLRGELTITSDMENLEESLYYDHVPVKWERLAYPSLLGLQSWFADLLLRFKELDLWSSDFVFPATVWLAGFFNPQSFLTAIMQQTARKYEWPLDRMCLCCEVTKKFKEHFIAPPKEGAFVHGLFMEGACWDTTIGAIGTSKLKSLFPMMPVIYIRAITQDKQDLKNIYECPIYKTRLRGETYVWTLNLKTKEKASKWVLGGVCLLLQV